MGPYDSPTTAASSSSSSKKQSSSSDSNIDNHLAGAGYRVRSSELPHLAQRLERLETAMANEADDGLSSVVYNPSDLVSWVDSLLSEYSPSFPDQFQIQNPNHFFADDSSDLPSFPDDSAVAAAQFYQPSATEEDSGIRLVHALVTCAEAVHRGDLISASLLIDDMQSLLLTRVASDRGIGKVAGYFIDALRRRILSGGGGERFSPPEPPYQNEILYHNFYEACPYLKFAHFTANQAILEAFEGRDRVHVVDFSLAHGLQWPALIQALALRPGGPPILRLTGIGPPSPDGRDSLRDVGLRLAELARSVNVRFAFRGVAAAKLDDVKPWMLHVAAGEEAVAVNSVFQLHRLIGEEPNGSGLESVLGWVKTLSPRVVTVVEQEADHNRVGFLERFTESLYYYSTMFDSLEACQLQPEKAFAEMYIQREICDVVCCEGPARLERHEPLEAWKARLGRAGFKRLSLGSNAFKQASMLLTMFSAEGFCVEERDGCLTLGWHTRPLISASAWQPTT